MIRSLAAMLALSVISSAVPSSSPARSSASPDGGGLFRVHGGTVHPDPSRGAGPGWLAGGAVGFGVSRGLFLLFGYDHIKVDQRSRYGDGIGAMTVQLELGKPFHGVVTPRVNVGAGVYVRSRVESYYTYPYYPYQYQIARTDAPFGMNLGGGISFCLSRRVMFDLDAHYHQTTGREDSKSLLTTLAAGLTFALGREEPPEPDGYVMANR